MIVYKKNRLLIRNITKYLIILGLISFSLYSFSEQLHYTKIESEEGYKFRYQWLDHSNRQQSIYFTLTHEGLFHRFRGLKSYQSQFSHKSIVKRIKKYLSKYPLEGVDINYTHQKQHFLVTSTDNDKNKIKQAYQELYAIELKVREQYLQDNFYQTFIDHRQVISITLDHKNIAYQSIVDLKALKPTILKKVSIEDIRKVTNFVLSLVQTIPLDTLQSPVNSSKTVFSSPLKLIWDNQGDYFSKMTLTAALLRALMPRIKMLLVYIDGHALIGINMNNKSNEISISHNDIDYLLADPSSSALLPLGKLSDNIVLAIMQGHYVVQEFHQLPEITKR